ncbi:hypothetical protein Tco_0714822 [Tanacetum coccineum]
MYEKEKDPEVIAKKISHKPIDYEKLNRLTEDFGKCFSPKKELSAEQAFWFHILNPTIEPPYTPPVIVDVPSELPKITKEENVNHDKCDLEPINKELENSMAKLLTENERLCNEVYHVKQVVQIVLWYSDSECSKHMKRNLSQLMNFVSKFMGLGHNLFFVGQFYDADLEVAFRKNTCFICNLEGVDLLSGSQDTNLYIISLDDMLKSSPICLLSKASKEKMLCVV